MLGDVEAGVEAALLLFIPLEPMSESGPPELCLCTHHPSARVEEPSCPGLRLAASETHAPLGSVVVYDAGLIHRGTANRATQTQRGASGNPRLMLHVVVTPAEARVRVRPEAFLSASAVAHVRKWRTHSPQQDRACGLVSGQGCPACLAHRPFATDGMYPARCAWCASARTCVPDLAGLCPRGPASHVGEAGLGGRTCPPPSHLDPSGGDQARDFAEQKHRTKEEL